VESLRTGTPKSRVEWIAEIAEAYRDAEEAIPFGSVTGQPIEEKDLFHFAPSEGEPGVIIVAEREK
jgi:hypothetical protein